MLAICLLPWPNDLIEPRTVRGTSILKPAVFLDFFRLDALVSSSRFEKIFKRTKPDFINGLKFSLQLQLHRKGKLTGNTRGGLF